MKKKIILIFLSVCLVLLVVPIYDRITVLIDYYKYKGAIAFVFYFFAYFELFSFIGISALVITVFILIKKSNLTATENINAYRERKAAERNARRKAKAEKKKAAIERELAALNTPEENEFSEK